MADTSSLPPPTGPRLPGPSPRRVAPAPDDVFSPRSGAKVRPAGDARVDAYQAGIPPQYSHEGTAVIDIPGASLPVTLTGLNGFSPRLLVDGKKARFKFPGKWIVPMVDGSEVYLRMWNYPFGYVRLKRDGVTVFEEPRPQGIDMFLLWALFVAPFLSLKVYFAGPVGIFSQWGAGIWLKKPSPSPLTKRLVLGGIVVLEVVFAIVILLLVINLLS